MPETPDPRIEEYIADLTSRPSVPSYVKERRTRILLRLVNVFLGSVFLSSAILLGALAVKYDGVQETQAEAWGFAALCFLSAMSAVALLLQGEK